MKLSMTERETRLGWCFFLIYMLIMPLAVDFVGTALRLSLTGLNILYFLVNFACTAGIFYRFLWKSMKAAWAKPIKILQYALMGFGIEFIGSLLVSVIISPWIAPDFFNVNDAVIIELSKTHTFLFNICTILLVPVTEEILFRGLLFGTTCKKRPKLALCISVLIFAAIHILDYIGTTDWKTLLVCFLQYLPSGFALAWAYRESENIMTPILMHITMNTIATVSLR
jgi:membrane protease YdiL (CAAX protease family)